MSVVGDKLKEFYNTNSKKDQIAKLHELLSIPEFRDELNNLGLLGYITATYTDWVLEPLREILNKKLSWRQLDATTATNIMNHIKNGEWVSTNDIYKAEPLDGENENKETIDELVDVLKKVSIYPDVSSWSEYLSSKLKAAYSNADWTKLAKIEAANYGDNKDYFTTDDISEEEFKEKLNTWTEKIGELFTQMFTSLTDWEAENYFFVLDPRFIYIALLQNEYFWNTYVVSRNDQMIVEKFQEISQNLMNSISSSFTDAGKSPEDLYTDLYNKYKEQFKQKQEGQSEEGEQSGTSDNQNTEPEPEEDVSNSDT